VFEDCNLKVDLPTNYQVKHSPNKRAKITIPDIGKAYIYAEIPELMRSVFIDVFLYDDTDTASIKYFIKEKDFTFGLFTPKEAKKEKKRRIKIAQSLIDTFTVQHPTFKTKGLLYQNYNTHITKEKYYYRIILDTRYGLNINTVNFIFIDFYTNKRLSQSELNTYINSWIKNIELTHYTILNGENLKKIAHDGRKPFEDGYPIWKKQRDSLEQIEEKQKRRFGGDTLEIGGFQDGYYIAFKTKDSLLFKHLVNVDSSDFYVEIYYYNFVDVSPFSGHEYTGEEGNIKTGRINIYHAFRPGGETYLNIAPNHLYSSFETYIEAHIKWVMDNPDRRNAVYHTNFEPNIKNNKDVGYVYKLNKNNFVYLYFFQIKDKYFCMFTEADKNFKNKSIIEFVIKNLDIIPKNR
jgi:hypothetical protein